MARLMLTDEAVTRLEAMQAQSTKAAQDRALQEALAVVLLNCESRVRDAYDTAVRRIQGD